MKEQIKVEPTSTRSTTSTRSDKSKTRNGIRFVITLKSFNRDFIKKGQKKIINGIRDWKLPIEIGSNLGQPLKRKRFCLIKSPHVDKKARSQYELTRQKSQISLSFYKQPCFISEFLLFWIQNSQFPGIQLTICRREISSLTN